MLRNQWLKNRREREEDSSSLEEFLILGAVARLSSTLRFQLLFWSFSADKGLSWLKIRKQSEHEEKTQLPASATGLAVMATGFLLQWLIFFFGDWFTFRLPLFLFSNSSWRLRFWGSEQRGLNTSQLSIWAIHSRLRGPISTIGTILFGKWIKVVRSKACGLFDCAWRGNRSGSFVHAVANPDHWISWHANCLRGRISTCLSRGERWLAMLLMWPTYVAIFFIFTLLSQFFNFF